MAKPPSSNKRENEKKRLSKRLEKQNRKEERKNNSSGGSFEDMIAYVDENGRITDTPPDARKKEVVDIETIEISTPKKADVEEPSEYRGRVEFFNQSKGFGFIKDLGSANKYFFHISNAPDNMQEGNIVFFELEQGAKGMNAVKIRLEGKPAPKPPVETETVEEETETEEAKED